MRELVVTEKQAGAADALLLGHVTFEELRGYWSLQTDAEMGVTEYLNNVSKYVVSSTIKDPEWERSTVLSGDLEQNVRELKGKLPADDLGALDDLRGSSTM